LIFKSSYLHEHPEEFGITNADNPIFWESRENGNTLPERMKRAEAFYRVVFSPGSSEYESLSKFTLNKWMLLGDYYSYKKDYKKAVEYYEKSARVGWKKGMAFKKLERCRKRL